MKKIKDKDTAYKFLENPLIVGDTSLYTLDELIDVFKTKFSFEVLALDFVNEIKLYEVTVDKTIELLSAVNIDKQKDLALLLVKTIHNYYCSKTSNSFCRWFLAGAMFVCFDCLKEDDQKFREAFLSFDKQDGDASSFCRLVIISAIEYYCRVKFRDVYEGYKSVIRFDGEVIDDSRNTENEEVLRKIWFMWCKNNIDRGAKTYSSLLKLDMRRYKKDSLYWATRSTANNK